MFSCVFYALHRLVDSSDQQVHVTHLFPQLVPDDPHHPSRMTLMLSGINVVCIDQTTH